jgi:SAM-dependent methyltransferase
MALGSELVRGGRTVAHLRRRTFDAAARVVAISRATASVASERLAVGADRMTVIPPGIWPLTPAAPETPTRPDTFGVLSVGRLDVRKGHRELIDAFALLRDRGVTCTLRIVGEGDDRRMIENLVEERQLRGVVELLGHRSDAELALEYERADAFALLTHDSADGFEGFGIVFIEAAQHGLPILAGRSGGSVEAIHVGVNGVLVESPSEAAEVLQRWMDDPHERQRLREGSLEWARRFDWSIVAGDYADVLLDASSGGPRKSRRSAMSQQTGRISTAAGGDPAFLEYLYDRLPRGPTLNLGAGVAPPSTSREVIFVDHVARSVPGQLWVVADINQLPFRDGAVGAVVLKDVLEHLPEPIAALAEMRRVTARGGRLAIVTPRAVPRAVWADPNHLRGFTRRALRMALEMAGWTVYRVPRRIGGIPGAGRYPILTRIMPKVMAVPVLGHWLGTGWLVFAEAP